MVLSRLPENECEGREGSGGFKSLSKDVRSCWTTSLLITRMDCERRCAGGANSSFILLTETLISAKSPLKWSYVVA